LEFGSSWEGSSFDSTLAITREFTEDTASPLAF
jgi:hypothetical protein